MKKIYVHTDSKSFEELARVLVIEAKLAIAANLQEADIIITNEALVPESLEKLNKPFFYFGYADPTEPFIKVSSRDVSHRKTLEIFLSTLR